MAPTVWKVPKTDNNHRRPGIDTQGVAVALAFLVGITLFAGEPRSKADRMARVRPEAAPHQVIDAELGKKLGDTVRIGKNGVHLPRESLRGFSSRDK